jgi:hypothetical protein
MLSHEIAEVITGSLNGWNAAPGIAGEVADLCSWRQGAGSAGDFLYYKIVNPLGKSTQANIAYGGRYFHIMPLWVNAGLGCCSMSWPLDTSAGQTYACGNTTTPI